MNTNSVIGEKVKQLRKNKNLTLKQVSDACGISIGFLSQFERGISSIALDSLILIADIFEVPVTAFFENETSTNTYSPVIQEIENSYTSVSENIYQTILSPSASETEFSLLPRIFMLYPFANEQEKPKMRTSFGEKFLYVLEGIVTFYLSNQGFVLRPGDSIHINSGELHGFANHSNKIAKILTVDMPNPLADLSD